MKFMRGLIKISNNIIIYKYITKIKSKNDFKIQYIL